jgi:hypothetical protein
MTSRDEIKGLVAAGKLAEIVMRDLRAADNTQRYRRWIYVTSDMEKELFNRRDESAFRRLSAQFQKFILGQNIPMALVADHKQAEWARLGPAGHEVWECRVRDGKDYLSVLGRFADVDIFIGFNLYDSPLRGKRSWEPAKARCQGDWAALFPTASPVYGATAYDYITTNFTLI